MKIEAKKIIWLLATWQFISVLMLAVSSWPAWVVWLNLALLLISMVFLEIFDSLLLLIISIPFYVALPNSRFDSLSMWRILFVFLFIIFLFKSDFLKAKKPREILKQLLIFSWDKYIFALAGLTFLVIILFAPFKSAGLRQLLFFVNLYLFYLVLAHTLKTREEIIKVIRYVVSSLALIITIGFAQLFLTFFVSMDTFWVYWASNFTKLYYGGKLMSVSLYSNSWFAFNGGRELRMFSIMPDSQSFAYLSVFAVGWGLALTLAISKKLRTWLWSGIRFAALVIILSGTRAVWVGVFLPFFTTVGFYIKKIFIPQTKRVFWVFVIILVLFAASPLINKGLQLARVGIFKESFIQRFQSIYDLNETSNQGRIWIWKKSLLFAATRPQGIGLANFVYILEPTDLPPDYNQLADSLNKRYNLPQKYITAHNLYLQVLIELGVLGLMILAGFIFDFFKTVWRFSKRHLKEDDILSFFVFQSGLILLWLAAAALFDVTFFNDKVLMYFLLTLALTGSIIKNFENLKQ